MSANQQIVALCDEIGRERLETVVRQFHERVLEDPVLGHHFRAIDDMETHIHRFAEFWWIGMGGISDDPPDIDMIGKHHHLRPTRSEMNRWLGLFSETLHDLLPADLATQWIAMAESISRRLRGVITE